MNAEFRVRERSVLAQRSQTPPRKTAEHGIGVRRAGEDRITPSRRLAYPALWRLARNGHFCPCEHPISIRLGDGGLRALSLQDAKRLARDLAAAIRTVEGISSVLDRPAGDS